MTETSDLPPFPPPPPPPLPPPPPPPGAAGPPRLVRDPDDKVVAGVCAAFGRFTDTDPVLWRVTVAVLTLFGGAGLVLYVLGWVLVPRRGQPVSALESTLRRPDRSVSPAGVLLVVIAAVVLLAVLDDGPGFGAVLVLAGIAYLVARERRDPRPAAPVAPGAEAAAPFAPPSVTDVPYGTPLPWADAPPPSRRPPSPLGVLTVSIATLVTGVLLALRLLGADGLTAPRVIAAALVVVGAGLLVGTWFGRARWLIAVGLVLVLALAATAATQRAGLDEGWGQRTWVPSGSASYRLGAGEGVLDLRSLRPGERAQIGAAVGAGSLQVLVPDDLAVSVVADVDFGEVSRSTADGRSRTLADGEDLHEEFVVGQPADAVVELDLEVGVGEIEVRRAAA